ncbi:hypothetical protein J5N97_015791 [Dioscorea zingiberensis]|uniref:Uncharacterized protein n=1 Tax=Dioscorea zingiberensis TaxID=325984 RepID=A0A9D5CIG9_9LILI|nr:hypothetical protein J5N97_015791 [Dioscorea zingiberensis]
MIRMVPSNIPLVEPSWGSSMWFPQAHVSSILSNSVHAAGQILNTNYVNESDNLGFGMSQENLDVHEHDTSSPRAFDLYDRGFHAFHDDDNHPSISDSFNFASALRTSNSGAPSMLGQQKFSGENRSFETEDYTDGMGYQTSRVNAMYSSEKDTNMRPSQMSQTGSSSSKSASDSSRDGSFGRVSKSGKDKWGNNPASSTGMASLHGKAMSGWQYNSSYPVSAEEDDDHRDRFPSSVMGNDVNETSESTFVTSHARTYRLSEYGYAQVKGSDQMIPIGPVLIGGPHCGAENHAMVPLTFFPTGPPVPFLTMFPVYNFQPATGISDGSTSQFGRDEIEDDGHVDPSDQTFDSPGSAYSSEAHLPSTASLNMTSAGPSEVHKSDILNSDFASHWQNLQYGRSCQNSHTNGQLIYPSPVMVPPVYLQDHFPLEAPGRPLSTNANLFAQLVRYGPRLVPITPLQQGPARPSAALRQFADGPPRFRGGINVDRPTTRNHRSNTTNSERSDLADREKLDCCKERAAACAIMGSSKRRGKSPV